MPSAASARRSRRLMSVAPPPDAEAPRPFTIIVIGRLLLSSAAGIRGSVDERSAASLRREPHISCADGDGLSRTNPMHSERKESGSLGWVLWRHSGGCLRGGGGGG